MDFVPSPAFFARYADHLYVAGCVSFTILAGVITYGSHIPAGPAINTVQQEIGEFVFEDGKLLPHHVYLYEFSETGEPYILGKKLPGIDYSASEARYANFGREGSQTFAASDSNSSWSEWLEKLNLATTSHWIQNLLWFLFGVLCALVVFWAWSKIAARLSKRKNNALKDIMAPPSGHTEEEHSKLNRIWRSTLISMCRERNTKIQDLKAEHAEKLAEQQKEIDNLRQMLDTQTACAQDTKSTVEVKSTTVKDSVEDLDKQEIDDEEEEEEVEGSEQSEEQTLDFTPLGTQRGPGMLQSNRKKLRSNKRPDGSIYTSKHPRCTPSEQRVDDEKSQVDDKQESDEQNAQSSSTGQVRRECLHFQQGYCKFGAKCFNSHEVLTNSSAVSESPEEPLSTSAPVQKADFTPKSTRPVCSFFIKRGVCRFGANCRDSHDLSVAPENYHEPPQGTHSPPQRDQSRAHAGEGGPTRGPSGFRGGLSGRGRFRGGRGGRGGSPNAFGFVR